MSTYHVTHRSSNGKTGPIFVTTSSYDTCPNNCPLKGNGCYASSGPLKLHWHEVSYGSRGISFGEMLWEIAKLPDGTLWRHNQAGDLPGQDDQIDVSALSQLVKANHGARGFTYTHKPDTALNVSAIREANKQGFTINLSANSLEHADQLSAHGLPVVTVLPSDRVNQRSCTTPAGRKVVVCPATRSNVINCSTCALCQKRDRDFIIGFPAHGSAKKKADSVARGYTQQHTNQTNPTN